jgi:hypothetical protein
MYRLTFQCTISSVEDIGKDPTHFANLALTHGDRHQDFFSWVAGEVKVEEYEGE